MAAVQLKRFAAGRVKRCRGVMAEEALWGLIVADPADVRYLTGFSGDDSVLVLTETGKVIVTDSRYVEQLKQECSGLRRFVRKGPMTEAVGEVLEKLRPKRAGRRKMVVGIEGDSVTHGMFGRYRKAVGKGFRSVGAVVGPLRVCKDEWEVKQICKAVRIAEGAVGELCKVLKVGMTELEAGATLDYQAGRLGSEGPAFESIVAFGGHGAQPHAKCGRSKLRAGQAILIDWGATVCGYRSDLTRCYCIGRIRPEFSEVYQRVLEAQLAAIDAVKPGAVLSEVDDAARKNLKTSPWPAYGHGTGHGIGLNIHEGPVLSPAGKGELKPGMVVTIEPGVYLPGRFGIRIEDDVLVTEKGRRVLSWLAKSPDSVEL